MAIKIQEETTRNPLSVMGKYAGECWGSNTKDKEANKERGKQCLKNDHGRVLEFPQIYLKIDGYSVRMMRELYTHLGGLPTRLQASTRYINYQKGFDYVVPPSIKASHERERVYQETMDSILEGLQRLEELGTPREDSANLLPLGMHSSMVMRTNLRMLLDMSRQRMCRRTYWEFRDFFNELIKELNNYDEDYKYITDMYFSPKCDILGYCTESKSCGRWPTLVNEENK